MTSFPAISDLPPEQRPRERLFALGPRRLRHAEVLAVVIGSGTQGLGSLELADRLLRHVGGVRGFAAATAAQLQEVDGVGPALAARIAAGLELGRRSTAAVHHSAEQDAPRASKS